MRDDERINLLKTPKECKIFAKNVTEFGRADLAILALKRSVELQAKEYSTTSEDNAEVEIECYKALLAYEEILSAKAGRPQKATRTRQMLPKYGLLGTVERLVNRKSDAAGYTALVDMGMQELAFEAVILRFSSKFSTEANLRAQERLGAQVVIKV